MSQLITLSKLATLVSDHTGIEISICESFIRNMAQTVASGLIEGEHIRVKDFGLFELSRSSDGETAVEFIPESSFAERVNAPFAHLRPAELPKRPATATPEPHRAPNPQAPSYPPRYESNTIPQRPAMPQTPSYPPQRETPTFPNQPAMPQAPSYPPHQEPPTFPNQPAMPQAPSYPPQRETPTFPNQPAMPQAPSSPLQPDNTTFRNQTPEFPDAPAMPSSQGGAPDLPSYLNLPGLSQSESEPTSEVTANTFSSKSSHPTGFNRQLPQLSTNKKFILIGVLGLIVGFVFGYLTAGYSSGDGEKTPVAGQEAPEVAENAPTPPVEQEYDNGYSVSVADVDTFLTDDETIDTPVAEAEPEPEPAPQLTTVKLQKGQRLSDIALKHYGKKEYWVYIYLENRESISNPFTVREGAVLRIPPKDKYAPTTDEAANLAWAKSKAAEINSKYIH